MLPWFRSGLNAIFRRSRWEREMNEELKFHIENRAEELERSGTPHAEALRRARVEFGGMESYKERCRDASGAAWIDELTRNLRYTGRSIRKRPGFAVVAVLSLALGIGANAAVFSLLKNLILTPLPVRDPKGLHLVVLSTARGRLPVLSYPMLKQLRDNFDIFSDVLGSSGAPMEVSVGDRTENANVSYVTGNYFESLGVQPALGRLIIPDDDAGAGLEVAVLSHQAWHSLFAGDPAGVSRTLKIGRIGKYVYRVIGVAPPEFLGTSRASSPDIYIPMNTAARHFAPWLPRNGLGIGTMVRLKPGVSEPAAQTILREGWPRFSPPRRNGDRSRPEYTMLEDGSAGHSAAKNEFSAAVVALMGLVAVVLLIACANLATLLLVRSASQTGEMSIRRALGASRAQLVRQWLTESLVIALVGGLAGLLMAASIAKALLSFLPEEDRGYLTFRPDGTLLLFTAALTLAAGFFFGLLPALRASKADPGPALCRASRSVTARGQLSEWLLAAQLAACLVLVTGAVLFARTLWSLNSSDIGFDRKNVVYAQANFMKAGYSQVQVASAAQQIVETIAHSPHIASVSMGLPPILVNLTLSGFAVVPGYNYADGEENAVYFGFVAPRYFETLSIPIIAGRDFNEHDRTAASGHPLIVNESFVRHYFQGRNPLGQSVTITTVSVVPEIPRFHVKSSASSRPARETTSASHRKTSHIFRCHPTSRT
jgi:predicted permease